MVYNVIVYMSLYLKTTESSLVLPAINTCDTYRLNALEAKERSMYMLYDITLMDRTVSTCTIICTLNMCYKRYTAKSE